MPQALLHTAEKNEVHTNQDNYCLILTTDACKKGNILGMHFQIIDFFYDW